MHNFICIQNDFIEIKKKQKFHEILLISIVGLLSTILLILVINLSSNDSTLLDSNHATKTEKNKPGKLKNENTPKNR